MPLCALGVLVLADMAAEAQNRTGEVFQDRFTTGPGQGPQMVVLPSGSFTMGSPASEPGRQSSEGPQRTVRIGYRLAVGRYEVTFDEWDACVAGGGCNGYRPDSSSMSGNRRGQRPVMNVSWHDAQAYISWLNRRTGLTGRAHRYRLLSEAEWEYAARAGTSTAYSFGEYDGGFLSSGTLGSHAWFYDNAGSPIRVGAKQPNAFGLYDMHGNVWEWVEDCWADNYSAGQPSNGSAFTNRSCSDRVVRGGSASNSPSNVRSSSRAPQTPGRRSGVAGFRVARTLPR